MLSLWRHVLPSSGKVVKTVNFQNQIRFFDRQNRRLPTRETTLVAHFERLRYKDPTLYYDVDIGFALPTIATKSSMVAKHRKHRQERRGDEEMARKSAFCQLNVDVKQYNVDWMKEKSYQHIKMLAKHYAIYQDLFGEAYFYPVVPLTVQYRTEDNTGWRPVYYGNILKPKMTMTPPTVKFDSADDTYWTLILTNPDGHFTQPNHEYVHWFIGNIPGSKMGSGDTIFEYLQPFPPRGTGYQRFVFILYQQTKKVDFGRLKKPGACLNLEDRTFKTYDFYREYQDVLTPAGLSFFQADWDPTLTDFYHNVLEMKEPSYEYDFPPPYIRPQEWFPKERSFNTYLDRYRDPKDVKKDFLHRKLDRTDPFQPHPEPYPFPRAIRLDNQIPSWLKWEMQKSRMKWGWINEIDMEFP